MTQLKSFDVWQSRLVAFVFLMLVPTLASAATIIPSRPRLYFTLGQLPELRQRIAGSHKLYWDTLTNWPQPDAGNYATLSGRDLDKTHFYIERNAFIYLMLADSDPVKANQHAAIARNWLMELTVFNFTQGPNEAFEILWAMAIGYDWLYNWPGLSDVDKQTIRDVLVARTDIHFARTGVQGFSDPLIGPSPSSAFVKSIFDNQVTENNLGVFFPGLALYEGDDRFGLNATAQEYVDGALARIELAAEALDKYAPNGGFWEGQSYYAARLQGDVYMIYAWKVATGEDLFEGRKNIRHAARYWTYGLRPDGTSSREGDVTCAPAGCARNRFIAEILADRYQDGHAQWYAHFKGALSDAGNPFTDLPFDWNDIVFYNPDLAALSPETLPLHAVFDIGRIVIRTGWNIGPQSPDTYVNYEIHDWPTGHTHYDVNSFTLWRKGSLAIDSGRYRGSGSISANHERNYALRTIAHNTMTIYKPGEDFATFSNDGGQEFIWRETNRPTLPFLHPDVIGDPSYMNDLEDGTRFDTATLENFAAGNGFYYIRGNATDAYHSTGFNAPSDGAEAKISNFTREFVLLTDTDAPIAVVFDRVNAFDPNYTKKWLLHSINEPLVNGSVIGTQVPGRITTHDGDQVALTHNQGMLFSSTLLPVQPVIRKVGGSGFEFWTDDPARNWPWRMDIADNEVGAWRIEISPSTSQADDTFLHVLALMDSTATSVPAAALLETSARYGAHVSDQVVFFSKSGEAIRDGESYSIPASTKIIKHVITNLAQDEYDVRQGGCKIAKKVVPNEQNVLVFESNGGGDFALYVQGQTPPGGFAESDVSCGKLKKGSS